MKIPPNTQNINPESETELAAREIAVGKAYDAYGTILLRYIRRFISNHHLAEDLFQTLWLTVLESFPSRQIMQIGMLKRRVRQIIINRFRTKMLMREIQLVSSDDDSIQQFALAEPRTDEDEEQFKKAFWESFKGVQLTDNEKDAFWLKERYGYTINEISAHFDVPLTTANDWIRKAKRLCAEYLNQNLYDRNPIPKIHRRGHCRVGQRHRQTASA
jgi:RNA polymerase sigma factor (sigma-70 family)